MAGTLKEHKNAKDKTGKLKPKYKDAPRYKAIHGYEDEFKDNFTKLSRQMAKDVVRKIADLA